MRQIAKFTVFGKPQPQGSTKAFIPRGWKRAIITSANSKMKPWRQEISGTAVAIVEAGAIPAPKEEAVAITLDFFLERPKSIPKRRTALTVKPDLDKLVRASLDALTGILFVDDAQVVYIRTSKAYGSPERLEITLDGQ